MLYEVITAEEAAEPSRHGDDDGVGDEVGGNGPRRLVDPRRESAPDVVERDVDDGGVDDLDQGRQHHRQGDDPLVHRTCTVGTTDIPTRKGRSGWPPASSTIFTGTRNNFV